METNKKINLSQKKRLILIACICIVLLVVVLLIFHAIFKGGDRNKSKVDEKKQYSKVSFESGIATDSKRKTISGGTLNEAHCLDKICVNNLSINCNDVRGLVTFTITNNYSDTRTGYLKILFLKKAEDTEPVYSTFLYYEDLLAGGVVDSAHGYDGFDLREVTAYKIEEASEIDIGFIDDKDYEKEEVPSEEGTGEENDDGE